jgi:hypothetical protein
MMCVIGFSLKIGAFVAKKKFEIPANSKIQAAVDQVYLSDEDVLMSNKNDDENDGLSFNKPEDDSVEEISVDLDHTVQMDDIDLDSTIQMDDIDLDIDLDGDLSLAEGEGDSVEINENAADDDALNLDVDEGDDLSLSADGDEVDNGELDLDEDDLDLSDDGDDLSLSDGDDDLDLGDDLDVGDIDDIDLDDIGEETGKTIVDGGGALASMEFSADELIPDPEADKKDFETVGTDTFNKTLTDLLHTEGVDEVLENIEVEEDEAFAVEKHKEMVQTEADRLINERDSALKAEVDEIAEEASDDSTGEVSENLTKDGIIAVDEMSYEKPGMEAEEESTGPILNADATSTIEMTPDLDMSANTEEALESGKVDISEVSRVSQKDETIEMTLPEMQVTSPQTPTPDIRLDDSPVEKGTLLTSLSSNELLDLRVTLAELREDRENLLGQISGLEEENYNQKQDNLSMKAEIDELKIEISIMKKRHLAEIEELRHAVSIAQEKKEVLEAKNKSYQKEIERLGYKLRVDFGKIKQREKDLESQLELMTMDADSKVKSRDSKILELKRKIDALEFNMENMSIKERQSRTDKVLLDDKLNKVVGTLRHSLKFLEEEMDIEEIKKDLDL